jgi:hypothetical protein
MLFLLIPNLSEKIVDKAARTARLAKVSRAAEKYTAASKSAHRRASKLHRQGLLVTGIGGDDTEWSHQHLSGIQGRKYANKARHAKAIVKAYAVGRRGQKPTRDRDAARHWKRQDTRTVKDLKQRGYGPTPIKRTMVKEAHDRPGRIDSLRKAAKNYMRKSRQSHMDKSPRGQRRSKDMADKWWKADAAHVKWKNKSKAKP